MGTVSKTLNIVANTTYNLAIDLWAWSIWATEAGITTTYSSLADLLADEKAVRQLMIVHKSVDYLANYPSGADRETLNTIINNDICAKWINLSDYALDTLSANADIKSVMDEADKYGYGEWVKLSDSPETWGAIGDVPIMTANNAPYGVASASSVYATGTEAYKAFDGSGVWTSSTKPAYVQYQSTSPICIKKFKLINGYSGSTSAIKDFQLLASNDGSDFSVVLYSGTLEQNAGEDLEFDIDESKQGYYLYHRLYVSSNYGGSNNIRAGLQFYGREQGTLYPTELLSSASQNGYVVTQSSYYQASNNNHPGYGAFIQSPFGPYSNTNNRGWVAGNNGSSTQWLQLQLPQKKCFNAVYIRGYYNFEQIPYIKWKILGSNDGFSTDSHELITDITLSVGSGSQILENVPLDYFSFDNNEAYQYYRIVGETKDGSTVQYPSMYFEITAIKFVENTLSEKEFATGSTRKTIYDHGIKFVTFDEYLDSGSIIYEPNQIYVENTATNHSTKITTLVDYGTNKYSMQGMIVGNKMVSANNANAVYNTAMSSAIATSVLVDKYNALDVSSISGQNRTTGVTYYGGAGTFSITEWWLE